jgi:hypothetical protein
MYLPDKHLTFLMQHRNTKLPISKQLYSGANNMEVDRVATGLQKALTYLELEQSSPKALKEFTVAIL